MKKKGKKKEPGHVGRRPFAGDAGGAGRSVVEGEASVALVHDLSIIGHFAHVRPVVVEAHVAHQQHLAVLDVARKRTVN